MVGRSRFCRVLNGRRSMTSGRQTILQKRDALHARNLEALAAAHVLAHHHVVPTQHVRLRFGEFRAVAIVRAWREALLLHAHQPLDLILRRLMAMRTTQICRLFIGPFVKELTLIHKLGLGQRGGARPLASCERREPPRQPQIIAFLRVECAKMRPSRPCRASVRKKSSPPPRSFAKWPANASAVRNRHGLSRRRRPSRRDTSLRWVSCLRMSSRQRSSHSHYWKVAITAIPPAGIVIAQVLSDDCG